MISVPSIFIFLFVLFVGPQSYSQSSIDITSGGSLKLATDSNSCVGNKAGALRLNTTSGCAEYCDGMSWKCPDDPPPPCDLAQPANFTFNDQSGVAVSTLIESNIVQLSGLGTCIPEISISGQGTPEYRVCSDATCTTEITTWSSANSTVLDGQYVQLRLTSDTVGNRANHADVNIGKQAIRRWYVVTGGDCSVANPDPGTYCADGTRYLGIHSNGTDKVYVMRCLFGQVWNGVSCEGWAQQVVWSDTQVVTGATSTSDGAANTATLVGLGSNYIAAVACDNLVAHGHSDWYVPASSEYAQDACSGGPSNTSMHTSTEVSATDIRHRSHNWCSGNYTSSKLGKKYVRCIRKAP